MKFLKIVPLLALCINCSSSVSSLPKTLVVRASSSSTVLLAAGTPARLRLTAKRMWLSTNADCSNAFLSRNYLPDGAAADATLETVLSSSSPDENTYNCLILEISDQVTFSPDSTAAGTYGSCVEGTDYTYDLYRQDNIGSTWVDYSGTVVTATGTTGSPGSDNITFFLSTNAAAAQSNFSASANQVKSLASSFSATHEIIFYLDFTGLIDEIGGECTLTAGDLTTNIGVR